MIEKDKELLAVAFPGRGREEAKKKSDILTIPQILRIMKENELLIAPMYEGGAFEIDNDEGEGIFLTIKTCLNPLAEDRRGKRIQKLFNAEQVSFLETDEPYNYWDIRLWSPPKTLADIKFEEEHYKKKIASLKKEKMLLFKQQERKR